MQVSNASGPSMTDDSNEGGPLVTEDNENTSVVQNENAAVREGSPTMFSEDSD